jgi:transketolase
VVPGEAWNKRMNEQSNTFAEQSAAFQKIWTDSMSKLMQAAFTVTPNSAPPELLRQIRDAILQALGESWNEFLRSPQFQQSMKQWMEQAMAFRKMTNDFMAKVRKEMQVPSRDDVDAVMLAMRHMETRILDQIEELANRIDASNQSTGKPPNRGARISSSAGKRGSPRISRRRARRKE